MHPNDPPDATQGLQRAHATFGGMLAAQYEGVQYNYFYGVDRRRSLSPPIVVPLRRIAAERLHGRTQLIESQTAAMQSGGEHGRVQVLHGIGGSGKTTVALEVAHRALENGIRVWWVRASDDTSLVAALHTVAFDAGANDDELTYGHPADALWRRLDMLEDRWLVVLDNADNADILAAAPSQLAEGTGWLRPPARPVGHVLVTTRDGRAERWGAWSALHQVDVLDRQLGARILLDHAPDAGAPAEAEALAERLGGLPLALELAGNYLAAVARSIWPDSSAPDTFDRYRRALDEERLDLGHTAGSDPEDVARRTIGSTWELSLDLIAERGHAVARPLMRLLSCLGPAPIPYMALLDPVIMSRSALFPNVDVQMLSEALGALAEVGLIGIAEGGSQEPEFRRVTELHLLVRDANRQHADVRDHTLEFVLLITDLLDRATAPLLPDAVADWHDWAILAPHCGATLPLLRRLPVLGRSEATASTAAAFGAAVYRWAAGLYAAAEVELRTVLDIRRWVLGDDDPETLAVRHALGLALRDSGRFREAEAELGAVLAVRQRSLGDDAINTLSVRHALALTFRDEGRYHQAETELRTLLSIAIGAFGEDHTQSLQARHSLASVVYALGQFDAAEHEYQGTLDLMSATFGATHPRTLRTRHARALALRDLGRLDEAEAEFRSVLTSYGKALGERHPQTLRARYNLASVLHARTQFLAAEREYRSVLGAQRDILGESHPYTLRTRHGLGVVLRDLGATDEGLGELQEVLRVQRTTLGEHHHYTLRTRFTIATTVAKRDSAKAKSQLAAVFGEQLSALGPDHAETRATQQAIVELQP